MKKIVVVLLTMAINTMHGQVSWNSVEHVYQDLILAIGDASKIAPPIKSSRTESRVAYYSPSRQTIFIEEKFLEACAAFGSDSLNALSFILGHELAHFYRNHGWVSTNGMGYIEAEMKDDWKAMRKDLTLHAKDETEADIFSGFYSMVAGYNAMAVAGKTLKSIYQAYGIKDSIPGYPTLEQRVAIANNAMENANDLYILFNVGIYSLALQEYDVASRLFTHIYRQDYSGTEILNNLAVSEILQGYKILGEDPSYSYPVFISTESALDPNSRGNEGEEHIKQGIFYLKEALKKSEDNVSVLVNLASAYAMLNEFIDAEYYLAKVEAINPNSSAIACLEGIIAMKKGDTKTAKKTWKKNAEESKYIAFNYASYFGKSKILYSAVNKSPDELVIDNVDLGDPRLKSKFHFADIKIPGMRISYSDLESSRLIELYAGAGTSFRFQIFESDAAKEHSQYNWKAILNSNESVISESESFNILKIETKGKQQPAYVKYSVN